MRYISLFAGIEAASCAWDCLGWEPVAFSEIDPFACAVLAHHYPDVPNLGDITQIDWKPYAGTVDLVVGGSPCQSFSIAGGRESLDGESRLMFEYVRAVREIRPRWLVWENVPGALSAKGLQGEKGGAFGCLLRELDDLGYGLAWRVLDAQFFGVAQRRRRVFVVGSLGDLSAAEVLFERDSLRWDHPSSAVKRQELAADARVRSVAGGPGVSGEELCGSDRARPGSVRASGAEAAPAYTLQVRCGCAGGGKGALIQEDVSATLSTSNVQTLFQPLGFKYHQGVKAGSIGAEEEVSPTLTADYHNPAVCYAIQETAMPEAFTDVSDCLTAAYGTKWNGNASAFNGSMFAHVDYRVRRLTPTECERLQGFPDGWTNIEINGKPAKDTPRYKALGNSMAVPVMSWIGKRIEEVAA